MILGAPLSPADIQARLCRYYGLEGVPSVEPFVHSSSEVARERVLVREDEDGLELRVELPEHALVPRGLDAICQAVEGVSHFVLIADRARRELPTSQLELELQAELDKFVLLGVAVDHPLAPHEIVWLRDRLFGDARFLDPPDSVEGARYRLVHRVAGRMAHRLERDFLRHARWSELRATLRRFYGAGLSDKLALAA